jgi:hypothetical protein
LTARRKQCDHDGTQFLRITFKQARDEMEIDKDKVVTQDETGEAAPVDQVEGRVEAEMKRIEGRAKEAVAQGLHDEEKEREGRQLQEEGQRELDEQQRGNS